MKPRSASLVKAATAAIGIGIAAIVFGCGGSGSTSTSTSHAHFAGTATRPPKPAPPLELKDSLGHEVNIDDYRGQAVLVTFIYTHCPDVCPLIVGNLHTAQSELGPEAQDLQIIAVSVDPKGDTPTTVNRFLREHQMTGRMEYLTGSRRQLERVWRPWFIHSKPVANEKNADLVEHSALIYGVSGSGEITTIYPASFVPHQIVHDVPILASR